MALRLKNAADQEKNLWKRKKILCQTLEKAYRLCYNVEEA
jgi:hypothetical protein